MPYRLAHTKLWHGPVGAKWRATVPLGGSAEDAIRSALRLRDEVDRAERKEETVKGGSDAAPSTEAVMSMEMGVERWLVDTGCPYNLIDWRLIEDNCLSSMVESGGTMVRLNTANGATKSSDSIKVACSQFEEGDFTACVLPSTPSVISVGERCIP